MQTTIIVLLSIVCLALARACQVLYTTLKIERRWADDPASFPKLVERMCYRATKGDELEWLRVEVRKALRLLNERRHNRV